MKAHEIYTFAAHDPTKLTQQQVRDLRLLHISSLNAANRRYGVFAAENEVNEQEKSRADYGLVVTGNFPSRSPRTRQIRTSPILMTAANSEGELVASVTGCTDVYTQLQGEVGSIWLDFVATSLPVFSRFRSAAIGPVAVNPIVPGRVRNAMIAGLLAVHEPTRPVLAEAYNGDKRTISSFEFLGLEPDGVDNGCTLPVYCPHTNYWRAPSAAFVIERFMQYEGAENTLAKVATDTGLPDLSKYVV